MTSGGRPCDQSANRMRLAAGSCQKFVSDYNIPLIAYASSVTDSWENKEECMYNVFPLMDARDTGHEAGNRSWLPDSAGMSDDTMWVSNKRAVYYVF